LNLGKAQRAGREDRWDNQRTRGHRRCNRQLGYTARKGG
jgi:hypothetical protein